MEKIDWNAIGLIICRTDDDSSKTLAEDMEKVIEERFQESVSGR